MSQPLITVIVSIYNGQKYLAECIESIINQDYPNLEIILVNDGSKDDTKKIIDEFAQRDSRIIPIHQNNSGVSASRNNALNIAKGEYVSIMDQDDVLASDYISYLYGLIQKNDAEISLTPTADIFFEAVHPDSDYAKEHDRVRVVAGQIAAIEMLYHKYTIAPWNKLISKKLIDSNKIRFNTNYYNGEGFAYSVECFMAANRVAIGERHIYHYRVGDPTTGASVFKLQYIHSSINAQQYIKSTFKKTSPNLLKAWNFSNWHTHCDALNVMVGCGAQRKHADLYDEISSICRKGALKALFAPISLQQKFRGFCFFLSPALASRIINKFRIRKFKKIEE